VKSFLKKLQRRESSALVCNQYQEPELLENLRIYLEEISSRKSKILIVGEAPGHKGCRLTGIPFTSGTIIRLSPSPLFATDRNRFKVHESLTETSAEVVWGLFDAQDNPPLFWNAFPFHPHQLHDPNSNRKPNAAELREGEEYLQLLVDAFKPLTLVGVGRVAQKKLKFSFPDWEVFNIRHPARGGKNEFIKGMDDAFQMSEEIGF
jgi:uracil-DNA glycosylase